MADSVVAFGAQDPFGLSVTDTNFAVQNNSQDTQATFSDIMDKDGSYLSSDTGHDETAEVTATYKYNAVTGLGAALPNVGAVTGGYMVTSCGVASTNDDFPTVTVSGHNHTTNPHDSDLNYDTGAGTGYQEFRWPSTLTTLITGAFGSYDALVIADTGTEAAASSCSMTLECDHDDVKGGAGGNLAGENFNGRVSISETYNGVPTDVDTLATYQITSNNRSTDNSTHYTVSYSATVPIAKNDTV